MKSAAPDSTQTPAPLFAALALDEALVPRADERARAFAQPLLEGELLETGEDSFAHALGVARILAQMGASEGMQAASFLVYAANHLNKPAEVIGKAFGESYAKLSIETNKLVVVQRQARSKGLNAQAQLENTRRMLLAFSRDLRVVMLRLASRLQSLRWFAASKSPVPREVAAEALTVFAPLANRLGIWQIKWEIEDLAFRFLEPETYKHIANQLDEKRTEREAYMAELRERLSSELAALGITAEVQGRPKHIYSIYKKMQGKSLGFDQVFDVRALRVIVPTDAQAYAALAHVHTSFVPIDGEFDDYIARPKANGYQSLHTVVRDTSAAGRDRPFEIQIRTQAMHAHAEHGVAAHWAYKEAGAKGYSGVSVSGAYEAKLAVLRQLIAWERDIGSDSSNFEKNRPHVVEFPSSHAIKKEATVELNTPVLDDRIYVLTPDAAIIDLPTGATPVDFAYAVHTNLGHRCRGARVDGALVTLSTPLQSGQTVEITAAKEGGPSRDWLNAELGYLVSNRARAKVRAWFNEQVREQTAARGREQVEKLLQREGKTALKLDDLAADMGFDSAEVFFEAVGKDELSLKTIEAAWKPQAPSVDQDEYLLTKKQRAAASKSGGKSGGKDRGKDGVLVVGVDSLLTQLAKCCKPAPPDAIAGFVTRGKGVSIHREDCSNFQEIARRLPDRVIDVTWGLTDGKLYAVDIAVTAQDRTGLLRDISEVLAKEKCNVIGVQTQTVPGQKKLGDAVAWMSFTVELADSGRLNKVLSAVRGVAGVQSARRK